MLGAGDLEAALGYLEMYFEGRFRDIAVWSAIVCEGLR